MKRLGAAILMLHHVEPQPLQPPPLHPDSYVSPAELGRWLDDLARHGYRTWTLAAAVERHRRGEALPRKSVVLTFDDACRCFAEHALPELARRAMTATLFAVASELGGTNRWDVEAGERRERLLAGDELARLAAQGIEIGCHGLTHRDLTGLDAATLTAEVEGSRRLLEAAIDRPVASFCYPYGRLDAAGRAAVEHAGYTAAVAIHRHPGAAARDLFALERFPVRPGESRSELRLKASGAYATWSRLPRLGLLSALRRREPHS